MELVMAMDEVPEDQGSRCSDCGRIEMNAVQSGLVEIPELVLKGC